MSEDRNQIRQQLAQEFTALTTDFLWQLVIDENQPEPTWLTDPAWQSPTLQRVLASGVDKHDLTDLVRELQVQMVANFAQFLDYPQQFHQLLQNNQANTSSLAEFDLIVQDQAQTSWTVGGIYGALLRTDPCQRFGETRSLVWRRWQQLESSVQIELAQYCQSQQFAHAAALWKAHTATTLSSALHEVKQLAHELAVHKSAGPA